MGGRHNRAERWLGLSDSPPCFAPNRHSYGLRAAVSDLGERLIPSCSATGVAGRNGMAQKRSEMRRVKEVLRLRLAFGLSHKAISAACRMPRATVRDYCQRAKAAGIDSFAAVEPLSGACLIQGGERGR